MFLFEWFRSFLPLHNPIGFGAADFIELALAALLVLFARAGPAIRWLEKRPRLSLLLITALPIALRLALLPHYAVPVPAGADDFSYLLLGDTLAHFRLANPPHPLHQFFEADFVLQEPSYSSIYPLGQGIVLALGRIFGHPWAGVALSVAAFCGACYWMLRGWVGPRWALIGGLLAACEFGPLNKWMNDYWGGAVSAAAGCLVFGALPRLREYGRTRDAILLGSGLAIQLLTRPFEAVLLVACAAIFLRRQIAKPALLLLPAIVLILLQNHAVTGNWTTLPYQLSRYQYGVPASFTVQPNPTPHRTLTPEQQLDYDAQVAVHGSGTDTFGAYWSRFVSRLRFYRFFFLAPLYAVLPVFLLRLRERRFVWVLACILIFALGTNFYPYFYPHYIAALACLFVLVSVTALERAGPLFARIVLMLCAAHFVFWYGLHLAGNQNMRTAMAAYETWDFINYGDPDGRIGVDRSLAQVPGKQLVFVRYWPQHMFREWIHNDAAIDAARVVWAGDLGADENEKLLRYYPDRTAWLLEPDARPVRLTPYTR